MSRTDQIAAEIAAVMPRIARWLLFDFFQTVQIPQTQLFALLILHEQGPCRFSRLCQELHISAPTATGLVDRMAQSGLVRRDHDREDRRAVNVRLTPNGQKVAKRLKTVIHRRWCSILVKLPAADREHYVRIIKRILQEIQHNGRER